MEPIHEVAAWKRVSQGPEQLYCNRCRSGEIGTLKFDRMGHWIGWESINKQRRMNRTS